MPKRIAASTDRKFEPKVRMVRNGSRKVNAIRACTAASLTVTDGAPVEVPTVARVSVERGSMKGKVATGVMASVFIRLHASSGVEKGKRTGEPAGLPKTARRRGNLITADLSFAQMQKIAEDDSVAFIELGDPLKAPEPSVDDANAGAPAPRSFLLHENRHKYGRDVLIGIIDVQGFDFAHPDFLRAGKTRFVAIWDQGGNGRRPPKKFSYGSEITAELMNDAIQDGKALGIPATMVEKQSQMVPGSHGTHVASIAAGNTGICRNADIAAVLVSIPSDELARRKSFYDSTRIAHAIDWILRIAGEKDENGKKKYRAVSINISLGTNGHAHDASSSVSRWIDHAMAIPGRCVTVAAGNAGQEAARFQGDIGFVMGRIHTSGIVAAKDLHQDLEWIVVGDGKVDVSENELEIWYGPQDRLAVQVKTPSGKWLERIEPRQFIENRRLPDGSMISIYNELYHPANGANYISIYLAPFFSQEGMVGIPKGTWTVRLIGLDVRNGRYHGWIERDDPRPLGRIGPDEAWAFPSFFSERSNVDDSSVSSLACGRFIISVANLDELADRINTTSSQGPTRDGRYKPDIAAPGTKITAAKGFAGSDDLWIEMSGTSMASPYVCGIAGLMLNIDDALTSSQIEGIMQRTAQPLPGATFAWKNDAGYGRIHPEGCLAEAMAVNAREDRTS